MADGRCYTTYIQNCTLYDNINKVYNVQNSSSSTFRQYMQTNAKKIMTDMKTLSEENSCGIPKYN